MHPTKTPSPALPQLTSDDQHVLLRVAADSIENGLRSNRPLSVTPEAYSSVLQERWAVFVTLHRQEELRGCIGTIQAEHPLVAAVARYAYYAAFQDSRFEGLTWEDWPDLDLHISILSRAQPLAVRSEAELLAVLRPGVDGLILEEHPRHATFLPSVWESLPDKSDFVRRLKQKGGWSADEWSDQIQVSRYVALGFGANIKTLV